MRAFIVLVLAICSVEAFQRTSFAPRTLRVSSSRGTHLVNHASYLDQLSPAARSVFVNEEKSFAAQRFPISNEDLVEKAKEFVNNRDVEALEPFLDKDFTFSGPVVGPLSKSEYLKALKGFDIYALFPDMNPQFYGFTVDPLERGRVWIFTRNKGTNFDSGKSFQCPPEVISLKFTSDGMVINQTISVADRTQGNTGGLGGLFGPLFAIGKGLPFREAQPFKQSFRYKLFNLTARILQKFAKKKEE